MDQNCPRQSDNPKDRASSQAQAQAQEQIHRPIHQTHSSESQSSGAQPPRVQPPKESLESTSPPPPQIGTTVPQRLPTQSLASVQPHPAPRPSTPRRKIITNPMVPPPPRRGRTARIIPNDDMERDVSPSEKALARRKTRRLQRAHAQHPQPDTPAPQQNWVSRIITGKDSGVNEGENGSSTQYGLGEEDVAEDENYEPSEDDIVPDNSDAISNEPTVTVSRTVTTRVTITFRKQIRETRSSLKRKGSTIEREEPSKSLKKSDQKDEGSVADDA